MQKINARIQSRRDTSATWSAKNPILAAGEVALELDTDRIKKGDGIHTWNQLPYYVSETTVAAMIADAVVGGGGGDNTALIAELADDGHPEGLIDGKSFELLYENGKV